MEPPEIAPIPILVTGAAGRVGRALRVLWGPTLHKIQPILWQSRQLTALDDLFWDIGQNPPPVLPKGLILLHLAGKTSGAAQDLAQNAQIINAVCAAAVAAEARHMFLMSTAAVYAPGPLPLDEAMPPAPQNPYGASKLAAEAVAVQAMQGRLTILRLGNLAGADALLGNTKPGVPVSLDPVVGQVGGPERSYIGPRVLAQILADLIRRVAEDLPLPHVLNLAQQPPVAMADLLQARGQPWSFGPPRASVVPRVALNTDRLAALTDVPRTSPQALISDLDSMPGWPL